MSVIMEVLYSTDRVFFIKLLTSQKRTVSIKNLKKVPH